MYPFLLKVDVRRHMKKITYISNVFDDKPATDLVARTLTVRRSNPQSCTSDAQVIMLETCLLEQSFHMKHHPKIHIM